MRLCEVDVATQPGFARARKQREEVRTFGLPGAATDQYDKPGVGVIGCHGQKIVPVAGDEEESVFVSVVENIDILCIHRQRRSQFGYFVPLLAQYLSRVRRDIVIQEKLHNPSSTLIWSATSASISPRWSS